MFVFRGHWVAVMIDDQLDMSENEKYNHRTITEKGNNMLLPKRPELILPAIIEIRNNRLNDRVRLPLNRITLTKPTQPAVSPGENMEISKPSPPGEIFRKFWKFGQTD